MSYVLLMLLPLIPNGLVIIYVLEGGVLFVIQCLFCHEM